MVQALPRVFATFALLLALFAQPAFAQDAKAIAAQAAARSWLALTDQQDAKASYEAADPKFKSSMTLERWTEGLTNIRGPLGRIDRRTVTTTKFTTKLRGFPPGDYAIVVFRSTYSLRQMQETVTLDLDSAGAWRVVGYSMS
jgi:hypothetical protein